MSLSMFSSLKELDLKPIRTPFTYFLFLLFLDVGHNEVSQLFCKKKSVIFISLLITIKKLLFVHCLSEREFKSKTGFNHLDHFGPVYHH